VCSLAALRKRLGKIKFKKLAERNRNSYSILFQGASLYQAAPVVEVDHYTRDHLFSPVYRGYVFFLDLFGTGGVVFYALYGA
jgi:hypothetical protein